MRADASGVQPNGEVLEANETNNVLATAAIQVVKPDLTVLSVSATPGALAPGANVSVTHVVKNLALAAGAASASTSRLYLSNDPTLDDPGDIVLGDVAVGRSGWRCDGHGDEERADPGWPRAGPVLDHRARKRDQRGA